MKTTYVLSLICFVFYLGQAQVPSQFSYQGVLRDNDGMPLSNQQVSIRVNILNNNDNSVFEEIHNTSTNQLGLVTIQVGSILSDQLITINWGQGTYFLEVAFDPEGGSNFGLLGRIQILSVPYAFLAQEVVNERDGDSQNEIQTLSFDSNTNLLSISGGNEITIPSGGTDADADPTNEIQTLDFNVQTNILSISGGNEITIPSGGTDADPDPTNEIQEITKVGQMVTLSRNGGSFTDETEDADPDPTNEIQTLGFNTETNMLSISGGNEISIPSGGTDADADPLNEIQQVTKEGQTVTLSKNGGSFTDETEDDDPDPTNEIQTLTFDSGTNRLSISGGNEITIPSGGTDADADPTNEIQTLDYDPETNKLTISGGNDVTISSGGGDADADPLNEIQQITKSGQTVALSKNGGSFTDETEDADADPTNEIQTLTFDAGSNRLSISGGNGITIPTGGSDADADPANEIQQITKSGQTVTLSKNGGSFTDETEDDDADPENELQTLKIDNQTLSILNPGGDIFSSVTLPTGGGGSSLWEQSGNNIFYNQGQVSIGTTTPFQNSEFNVAGTIALLNNSNSLRAQLLTNDQDAGILETRGTNGNFNFDMSYLVSGGINYPNHAALGLHDPQGENKMILYVNSDGMGEAVLQGINDSDNIFLSGGLSGNTGFICVKDAQSVNKVEFGVNESENHGALVMYGPSASLSNLDVGVNFSVTSISGFPNNGSLGLYGPEGFSGNPFPRVHLFADDVSNGAVYANGKYGVLNTETTACLYIDRTFGATVQADIKNFVMDHPEEEDKEIVYASLEGPEAGAYARGSAQLVDGKAFVPYSDHFKMVANGEEATIMLTPLFADTYGLAIVKKSAEGFWVEELKGEKHSFSFDWEAKAVRKGFESYEVVRPKRQQMVPNQLFSSKQNSKRSQVETGTRGK